MQWLTSVMAHDASTWLTKTQVNKCEQLLYNYNLKALFASMRSYMCVTMTLGQLYLDPGTDRWSRSCRNKLLYAWHLVWNRGELHCTIAITMAIYALGSNAFIITTTIPANDGQQHNHMVSSTITWSKVSWSIFLYWHRYFFSRALHSDIKGGDTQYFNDSRRSSLSSLIIHPSIAVEVLGAGRPVVRATISPRTRHRIRTDKGVISASAKSPCIRERAQLVIDAGCVRWPGACQNRVRGPEA